MPSLRPDVSSGGGFLRKKDGTFLRVEFSKVNPAFKGASKFDGPSESGFEQLWAIVTILQDGKEEPYTQSLKAGNAADYEIVNNGYGVSGTKNFSTRSGWGLFLSTLMKPSDGGEGFDFDTLPQDPNNLVADYQGLTGIRAKFDWQVNEYLTTKKGRKPRMKNGQPVLDAKGEPITDPREDLIVASYYGKVTVAPAAAKPVAGKVLAGPKPAVVAAKPAAVVAAPVADVEELAATKVVEILRKAKGNTLKLTKLSVQLLTSIDADSQTIDAVREWARNVENLEGLGLTVEGEGNAATVSIAA